MSHVLESLVCRARAAFWCPRAVGGDQPYKYLQVPGSRGEDDSFSIVIRSPSRSSLRVNVIWSALTHAITNAGKQTCDKDAMVANSTALAGP